MDRTAHRRQWLGARELWELHPQRTAATHKKKPNSTHASGKKPPRKVPRADSHAFDLLKKQQQNQASEKQKDGPSPTLTPKTNFARKLLYQLLRWLHRMVGAEVG